MGNKDKVKLAMELVKLVLGDDKEAYGKLGFQLLEYATGYRRRLHAGKRPKRVSTK